MASDLQKRYLRRGNGEVAKSISRPVGTPESASAKGTTAEQESCEAKRLSFAAADGRAVLPCYAALTALVRARFAGASPWLIAIRRRRLPREALVERARGYS